MVAPLPTSGTVGQYAFDQTKVLDHAFRRAGLAAEMASVESLIIAQGLLVSVLAEWCNAGFPLWTRENVVLGPTLGGSDIATPYGTVDVIHAYWRNLNPWRGAANTTAGADCSVLFGGAPNADVTIAGPNPGVIVSFGSATEVDTVGVLLGTSSAVTAALQVYISSDGVAWTLAQTLPSATYTTGQWTYFDLNPTINGAYVKLVLPGVTGWTLNQVNFGLANASDIMMGVLNIDDYYNLPNKFFQAPQAVSMFVDRQLNAPVLKIWPTLNINGFYNGVIPVLLRRYIQDPGAMTDAVEVPTRALEALIWRLASMLIHEIPDTTDQASQASYFNLMAKQQKIQLLESKAAKAEALLWAEERTKAPIRIVPGIGVYTK